MDLFERQLLSILQEGLPLSTTPYKEIADRMNTTEEEILSRMAMLKQMGFIRRIGGILNRSATGYRSLLCAVKVPKCDIETVAQIISAYPAVTHNYQRDHLFSLWFTFIEQESLFEKALERLEEEIHYTIHQFPSVTTYKTRVFLPLTHE